MAPIMEAALCTVELDHIEAHRAILITTDPGNFEPVCDHLRNEVLGQPIFADGLPLSGGPVSVLVHDGSWRYGRGGLRVKLARSLALSRTTSHSAIAPTDDLEGIIGKIFDFNLSNIAWVRAHLNAAAVAAAVAALSRAPRIEFFGMGASGIVATDAE
ncbi:MAG: hypothetical protein ACK5QX_11015, partial [bacterium]